MNIKIIEIKDRGNLAKERIVIRVLNTIEIGYHIVFQTKLLDKNAFSAYPDNIYWFPDREILKGDLVVLYTKSGKDSIKENNSGSKTHFFYWGLEKPSFKKSEAVAVIVEANGWIFA